MPSHEQNRRAYAARVAASLRASWATRPVPGFPSVVHYAAQLSQEGWDAVAEQAGELRMPSPDTRLEILRQLAVGERAIPRAPADPFESLTEADMPRVS